MLPPLKRIDRMKIETLIEKLQVIAENNEGMEVRVAIEKADGFHDRKLDKVKVTSYETGKVTWLVT